MISHYEHAIKKFERRYSVSFSDFSKKLEQGATIKENTPPIYDFPHPYEEVRYFSGRTALH
jgi:hypothetical protein